MSFIIIIFQFSEQKKRIQLSQIGPSVPQNRMFRGNPSPDRSLRYTYVLWSPSWWEEIEVPVDSQRFDVEARILLKLKSRADVKLCWRQWQDSTAEIFENPTSCQIFHFQEEKMQLSFSQNTERFHFWLHLFKTQWPKIKLFHSTDLYLQDCWFDFCLELIRARRPWQFQLLGPIFLTTPVVCTFYIYVQPASSPLLVIFLAGDLCVIGT